jgi:hypothetical protein
MSTSRAGVVTWSAALVEKTNDAADNVFYRSLTPFVAPAILASVATTRVLLIFICVKDLCWITTISCGMRKNRKCNILWRGFNERGISSSSFHACMTTSRYSHLNKFLHFRPTIFCTLFVSKQIFQ